MPEKVGFFTRLFDKAVNSAIGRAFSKIGSTSWPMYFGLISSTNINVDEARAQGISAVYTSLKVLSESVAQLPFGVYRDVDRGKEIQKGHPTYSLIHNAPNSYMTAYDFWYAMLQWRNAWGNAIAEIVRDGMGQAVEMHIIPCYEVSMVNVDGEMYYKHKDRVIHSFNIFHLKVNAKNGVWGISPIRQNAETFSLSIRQEQYANKVFGTKPPGFLTFPGNLTDDQKKASKESWQTQVEDGTPVLSGGFEYKPISIPPDDAQYVESRKFTKNDIYGIFRIPPTFAQDYERATFSNSEQQALVFVVHTLMPMLISIEQECNSKLFGVINATKSRPFYCKINVNGLLRGDINTRRQYYETMLGRGVMTPNEVRALEEMNGYEGGDRYWVQSGFIPVDRADDFIDKGSKPATDKGSNGQMNGTKIHQNGHQYA